MRRRALWFVAAMVLTSACGTAPSTPGGAMANIAGQWSGTAHGGEWRTSTIELTLSQNGAEVTGSIVADSVPGGFNVPVNARVSGNKVSGTVTHVRRGTLQFEAVVSGSTMGGAVDGISFAASRVK